MFEQICFASDMRTDQKIVNNISREWHLASNHQHCDIGSCLYGRVIVPVLDKKEALIFYITKHMGSIT